MSAASRGLLAGLEDDSLKRRVATAPYDRLWQRLQSRTREVMALAREGNFRTLGYGSLAWHSNTPMVREAALVWRLGGDADALRYVEEAIAAVDLAHRHPEAYRTVLGNRAPVNAHGEIALAADICRNDLGDAAREQLLQLMRERLIDCHRGDAPYTGYQGGGNVSLCQSVNAAWCAMTWGEACDYPGWREVVDHAVEYTRCYLAYGCDAKGFGYEGTGYSHSVFLYIYLLAQLLYQNGMVNLFAEEPRLRSAIDATVQLSFPGGEFLANVNDHGLLIPQGMPWLLYTSRHYNDPLHLGLWYAYQGPEHPMRPYGDVMPWYRGHALPSAPTIDETASMLQAILHWDAAAPYTRITEADRPTTVYTAGTETAVWRTSWSADAVCAHVIGAGRSHASQTHRHADCGHFLLNAYGDYLAIDTGRYNVDEDQHSVMLVDGECFMPSDGWGLSQRSGRLADFEATDLCRYIRADAAAMKDCCWADRHFLFVPLGGDDAYLVVIDNINKDHSAHRYLWQLQAHPSCAVDIVGPDSAVVRGERARLDVDFVIPGPEDFPQEPHSLALSSDVKEWAWPYGQPADDAERERALRRTDLMVTSYRRPRLLAEVSGLNGQIMTIIVPRRRDAPPLTVRRRRRRRLLQVEIEHPGGADLVVAALDHGYIRTPDIYGLTDLALVRRDANDAVLDSWNAGGKSLKLR